MLIRSFLYLTLFLSSQWLVYFFQPVTVWYENLQLRLLMSLLSNIYLMYFGTLLLGEYTFKFIFYEYKFFSQNLLYTNILYHQLDVQVKKSDRFFKSCLIFKYCLLLKKELEKVSNKLWKSQILISESLICPHIERSSRKISHQEWFLGNSRTK